MNCGMSAFELCTTKNCIHVNIVVWCG